MQMRAAGTDRAGGATADGVAVPSQADAMLPRAYTVTVYMHNFALVARNGTHKGSTLYLSGFYIGGAFVLVGPLYPRTLWRKRIAPIYTMCWQKPIPGFQLFLMLFRFTLSYFIFYFSLFIPFNVIKLYIE